MRYVLFCCTDAKRFAALSEEEQKQVMQETLAYMDRLRHSGHYISSERLQPIDTATMVQMRNGKPSTTDGPFAETKEQIGGFWLIEARDKDEAVRIACGFPSARLGGVQVRPVDTSID